MAELAILEDTERMVGARHGEGALRQSSRMNQICVIDTISA